MTRAILAAAIGLALMAPGSARAAPSAPERIVLPDNVVPERYAIVVTPEAASLTFAGSVKIAVEMRKATDRIVLNMADLKLERVRLSGREEAPSIELDLNTAEAAPARERRTANSIAVATWVFTSPTPAPTSTRPGRTAA